MPKNNSKVQREHRRREAEMRQANRDDRTAAEQLHHLRRRHDGDFVREAEKMEAQAAERFVKTVLSAVGEMTEGMRSVRKMVNQVNASLSQLG